MEASARLELPKVDVEQIVELLVALAVGGRRVVLSGPPSEAVGCETCNLLKEARK